MRLFLLNILLIWACVYSPSTQAQETTNTNESIPAQPELWKDSTQDLDTRVWDLVHRLTLAEKIQQIRNTTPAVPRLGIPAYDFWNECLHGVARAGVATVFPQAIGMAATCDVSLIQQEADVISTEARAKHHAYAREHDGNSRIYHGLTFWTPNINIFRDPRWGRGQETYGEDPFLTSRMGVAFIRGLQGDNPKYFKAVACAKHYAVHSGPEPERHSMDVEPSERDFYETYLPHFEAAVREGHVGGFMGAYNSVFGKPACASELLLTDTLRNTWGFDGYVVSDCGAINDIFAHHHFVENAELAAAVAVRAGCNICCGSDYNALNKAVETGLLQEQEIDKAVFYALKTRFRLGLFDPPDQVPYAQIPLSENDTPAHRELARKVARESIVLLKNDGLLPLKRAKLKRIAVIGANADSTDVLLGNYNGTPSAPVPILNGIRNVAGNSIEVVYARGCPLALKKGQSESENPEDFTNALSIAKAADVVVYVGGLNPKLEGEEMRVTYDGFSGGDRTRIELPQVQENFLKALKKTGRPIVFVVCSGSALALPWEAKNLPALLQAWYPGEEGGQAVAEVLFGEVNPAGRLPVTFYNSTSDLPAFTNYSMSNRTYRYFSGKPLFAFGHGLSYTRFNYSEMKLANSTSASSALKLSFHVTNKGERDGDEVAQVYFRHLNSKVPQAEMALCGFARVHLPAKGGAQFSFEIPAERLRYWDVEKKKYKVEAGLV